MHCGIWAFVYVPWGLRILYTAVYGHKLRALGVTAVYGHSMHSGVWAFQVVYVPWGLGILCTAVYGPRLWVLGILCTAVYERVVYSRV